MRIVYVFLTFLSLIVLFGKQSVSCLWSLSRGPGLRREIDRLTLTRLIGALVLTAYAAISLGVNGMVIATSTLAGAFVVSLSLCMLLVHDALPCETPSTDPLLLIIDMQEQFTAAKHPPTLAACAEQIRLWMDRNWPICILEYEGSGPTDPLLNSLLFQYWQLMRLGKETDDGSAETLRGCRAIGLDPAFIRVCGVNIGACVEDTVRGLLGKTTNPIQVVIEACNGPGNLKVFGSYPKDGRLRIESATKLDLGT